MILAAVSTSLNDAVGVAVVVMVALGGVLTAAALSLYSFTPRERWFWGALLVIAVVAGAWGGVLLLAAGEGAIP